MDALALERIEAQRLQLEENITKLRKSLRHWQTLEIDYEGIKEEILVLPAEAKSAECLEAARSSGAELVDEKELLSLIDNGGRPRKPSQVVDVLSKRIEYVSRNVTSIRKQISDAEKKRNALLLAEDSDHREEAGLPLTEITEELDDDDHIVSAKLQTTGSARPQLIEVLKKAGVGDIIDKEGTITAAGASPPASDVLEVQNEPSISARASGLDATKVATEVLEKQSGQEDSPSTIPATMEVIAVKDAKEPRSSHEQSVKPPNETSFVSQHPDDTEEDAALRQEMLQYGLGEVGAIVAELDLEENFSDRSFEDDADSFLVDSDFDGDEDEDDEDEGSEDEKGMAKNPVISDRYRRRMEELEKKLGMRGIQNLGPKPKLPQEIKEQLDRPPAAEAARKAALARAEAAASEGIRFTEQASTNSENHSTKKKEKKKVAFANVLDIAPDLESGPKKSNSNMTNAEKATVRPVGDTIVERITPDTSARPVSTPATTNKKLSRFKAARIEASEVPTLSTPDSDVRDVDDGMAFNKLSGKIVADILVERPATSKHSRAVAPDPDDIDEELHRRQIAMEYHKRRNRIIHQQGGFVGEGEDDNYGDAIAPLPIQDEITGNVKKISRFKAARMK